MKTTLWALGVILFFCVSAHAQDLNKKLLDAAAAGNTAEVKSLLEQGADKNTKSADGVTALLNAAFNGHTDMVLLLLEKGADVNASNKYGMTALMFAVDKSYTDSVRALLEKRAGVNGRNKDGATALIFAAFQGRLDIVRMLLEKGADVNVSTTNGLTALTWAASKGHTDIVRALLEKGADVNARDNNGTSVLGYAIGQAEVVRALLANGADVNAKDKNGLTALLSAAKNGHREVLNALLEAHPSVDAMNGALLEAAALGDIGEVQSLLQHGADVNAKNAKEDTPLTLATWKGHTDVVRLLLEKGADATSETKTHWSPVELAQDAGHIDTMQVLEGAVAQACDRGNAKACDQMGGRYFNDKNAAQNYETAAEYYRRACDGGNITGCLHLANGYATGHGVSKDYARATVLYQRVCDGGRADGCYWAGNMYLTSGLQEGRTRATEFYQLGCNRGNAKSCEGLGNELDEQAAAASSAACAELRREKKTFNVAECDTPLVLENRAKSTFFSRRACDLGDADGCATVGLTYKNNDVGDGYQYVRAAEFYQRACDGGSISGCHSLGDLYSYTITAKRNITKIWYWQPDSWLAARYYQKACDSGKDDGACNAVKYEAQWWLQLEEPLHSRLAAPPKEGQLDEVLAKSMATLRQCASNELAPSDLVQDPCYRALDGSLFTWGFYESLKKGCGEGAAIECLAAGYIAESKITGERKMVEQRTEHIGSSPLDSSERYWLTENCGSPRWRNDAVLSSIGSNVCVEQQQQAQQRQRDIQANPSRTEITYVEEPNQEEISLRILANRFFGRACTLKVGPAACGRIGFLHPK